MSTIRQTKNRIKSVQTTAKITKAMQAVAAMRLRRYSKKCEVATKYSQNLKNSLNSALVSLPSQDNYPALKGNPNGKILVVLVAPSRGFCGGLHRTCVSETFKFLESHNIDGLDSTKVDFMTVNRPGFRVISKLGCSIKANFAGPYKDIDPYIILPISELMFRLWLGGEYSQVFLTYAKTSSSLKPNVFVDHILPFQVDDSSFHIETPINDDTNFDGILDEAIPQYLQGLINFAILSTQTAEEGARMVAMNQATDNAKELTKKLQLVYFRQRQAKITQEISEIIGGSF
jgi:F-type H+-transporting ATPase subunit gamma